MTVHSYISASLLNNLVYWLFADQNNKNLTIGPIDSVKEESEAGIN